MQLEYLNWVFEEEGGYVNHPKDPGGETKWGITKRNYPDLDIKNLTQVEAGQIYYTDYWQEYRCESLPTGVDYYYFDGCVNHGGPNMIRVLQDVVGAEVDGVFGPNTLAAAYNYAAEKGNSVFLAELHARRSIFYLRVIGNRHTSAVFAKGWANRLIRVYSRSKGMLYAQ